MEERVTPWSVDDAGVTDRCCNYYRFVNRRNGKAKKNGGPLYCSNNSMEDERKEEELSEQIVFTYACYLRNFYNSSFVPISGLEGQLLAQEFGCDDHILEACNRLWPSPGLEPAIGIDDQLFLVHTLQEGFHLGIHLLDW
jgi:hypothetical protein